MQQPQRGTARTPQDGEPREAASPDSLTGETTGGAIRRAELVQAIAFAADLAFGLELEDGLRACYMACSIGEELGLSQDERVAVYYAALLKDAGCTAPTPRLAQFWQTDEIIARRELAVAADFNTRQFVRWLRKHPGSSESLIERVRALARVATRSGPEMDDALETALDVCERISTRLGLPASVQETIGAFFEQWDGKGVPGRMKGDEIPITARVVAPTFVIAPLHRISGRDAVAHLARTEGGRYFDPQVARAIIALTNREGFWAPLEQADDLPRLVLDLEPESKWMGVDARGFDEALLAFADFVDLKSPYAAAHSRRVGRLAPAIARAMGLDEADAATCGRGGLLHDLGLVAVPSYVLDRPAGQLRQAEREQLRLHPYLGARILERVPVLADLQPAVGAHHERFDGTGYPGGLRGSEIPLIARVVAVADRFDELTHDSPGEDGMEAAGALEVLRQEAGSALDPEVVAVVEKALTGASQETPTRVWPAGLTDREVEVLRMAATGITRKEIGRRLGISENTVRHHLEHIYNKTGRTTRVGAILFGIENGIIG